VSGKRRVPKAKETLVHKEAVMVAPKEQAHNSNPISLGYSVFQTGVCLFCVEIELLIPTQPVTSNLASIHAGGDASVARILSRTGMCAKIVPDDDNNDNGGSRGD
jgi:hypothetical protein